MRAKFLSNFEWAGYNVFSYLDLDTQEIVWLKDGRDGEEIRRWPAPEYNAPKGRAIDWVPRTQLFDWIKTHYPSRREQTSQHIYWAYKKPEEE
jgi:hypothetical protein